MKQPRINWERTIAWSVVVLVSLSFWAWVGSIALGATATITTCRDAKRGGCSTITVPITQGTPIIAQPQPDWWPK